MMAGSEVQCKVSGGKLCVVYDNSFLREVVFMLCVECYKCACMLV